jgi:hypothetical protein
MKPVEDEARIRTMEYFEEFENTDRTPSRYATRKNHYINKIVCEWYIDQKKPRK